LPQSGIKAQKEKNEQAAKDGRGMRWELYQQNGNLNFEHDLGLGFQVMCLYNFKFWVS
jgi:hypothetical protein